MSDLSLISTAAAAASSLGFLACLAVTVILTLVCRGLYRRARRLRRELDAAKESKQVLLGTLNQSYREKAHLTLENARLTGRVRDLLLQRRALGFALLYADDEMEGLASELRSTRRRLHAAYLRSCRQAGELHEAREALRSSERQLRWVREDNRILRGAALERSPFPAVVVSVFGFINTTAVVEFNDGSTRELNRPAAATLTASVVESRPAPTLLYSTTRPGHVSFGWTRNARTNTGVQVRVNGGQWIELEAAATSFELRVPDNSRVTLDVRNVWAGLGVSTTTSNTILTTRAA